MKFVVQFTTISSDEEFSMRSVIFRYIVFIQLSIVMLCGVNHKKSLTSAMRKGVWGMGEVVFRNFLFIIWYTKVREWEESERNSQCIV